MEKTLNFLQKVVCLILCLTIILSTLPLESFVFAADSDEDTFFTNNEGEGGEDNLKDIFSTTITDFVNVDPDTGIEFSPLSWITKNETFIVVKRYRDKDGNQKTKTYVNVPNLQQLAKNLVFQRVSDGYINSTYTPSDSLITSVGTNDNNVMDMFGFSIPSNRYQGEYPRIFMSLTNVLPTRWYQKIWRGAKALFFGYSFVEAPDDSNFKTLRYYNNQYFNESEEQLIRFIQKYYPYFEEYVMTDTNQSTYEYFKGPAHAESIGVTKQEYDSAKAWNEAHQEEYEEAAAHEEEINEWYAKYATEELAYENCEKYKEAKDQWEEDKATHETEQQAALQDYYLQLDKDPSKIDELGPPPVITPYSRPEPNYIDYIPEEPEPLSEEEQEVLNKYRENETIISNYEYFCSLMNNGTEYATIDWKDVLSMATGTWVVNKLAGYGPHNDRAVYTQCLLNNADKNCTKSENGKQYHISLYEFYVKSGLYKLTREMDESGNQTGVYKARTTKPGRSEKWYREETQYGAGNSMWSGGNCTDYASRRFSEIMDKSNALPRNNAEDWWGSVSGYSKGSTPQLGSILCLRDGPYSGWGHVAVVESIRSDGSIVTSESGWNAYEWKTVTRYPPNYNSDGYGFQGFIYNPMGGGSVLSDTPPKYKKGELMSRADATKILQKIQSDWGIIYTEVMNNFVIMVQNVVEANGVEVDVEEFIDPRVMPYDIETLSIKEDLDLMTVLDPRVDIYKNESAAGGALLTGKFDALRLIDKTSVPTIIINLAGKCTRLAVFFTQISNFEWLDNIGLSPTKLWKEFPSTIIILLLCLLFILKFVRIVYGYVVKGDRGIHHLIRAGLALIIMMAIVSLLTAQADSTWSLFKRGTNIVLNSGETLTLQNKDNIKELYGTSTDTGSISYYIPYFNLWSKYNTGYNLEDPEQKLSGPNNGTPETVDMKIPKLGGKSTSVWSVVLADSFRYNGRNEYVFTGITNEEGKSINGTVINSNAYRVVDHFLAPRVEVDESSLLHKDNLIRKDVYSINGAITNTVNENYNGQLQNLSIMTLLANLIGIFNLTVISLVKMLTFMWLWYMMYTFLFNIILGASSNHNMKQVLIKTFSPVLYLAGLSIYASLIIALNMYVEGFIGILISLVLVYATIVIINTWHNGRYFPATLKPIYAILHPVSSAIGIKNWKSRVEDEENMEMLGLIGEDGNYNTDDIFLEGGEVTSDRQAARGAAQYRKEITRRYNSLFEEQYGRNYNSIEMLNAEQKERLRQDVIDSFSENPSKTYRHVDNRFKGSDNLAQYVREGTFDEHGNFTDKQGYIQHNSSMKSKVEKDRERNRDKIKKDTNNKEGDNANKNSTKE